MRSIISVPLIGITGISAVTPHFSGVAALFEAWCRGACTPENVRECPDFATMSRAAVEAVCHSHGSVEAKRRGLLLATTKGDMEGQVRWMRSVDAGEESPGAVPTLGGSLALVRDSQVFGSPSYGVSTACTSGLAAIIESAMLILDGEADAMVAVGADVAGDFVSDGFQALRAISPTACRPFDRNRDGLTLGSAAAACGLQRVSPGIGCVIAGWGISNDATHMTAPDREAGGLIRAIRQALTAAQLRPADIGVVFAHGTGTKYNDAMEAVAIQRVFLQDGGSPAVTAVKGLIGHTLGAAGLIEAVLAVEMLRTQIIPPIAGLVSAEWPEIDFVTSARQTPFRHVLKIASGFGGMNAAIILSRSDAHHAD